MAEIHQLFQGRACTNTNRAQKRLILQLLKDGDLENKMTLKIRSRSPKLINSLFYHNDTIHKVYLGSIVQFKRYCTETPFWSKFDISKCWCDLKIRSRSLKSNSSFHPPNNLPIQTWLKSTHRFRRYCAKKADLYSLYRMMTLKISQGHQNLINSSLCHK